MLANINRNVLIQYASTLVNILLPKGILLVSGLLAEDEEAIVEVFNKLKLIRHEQKQSWISLLFVNKYNF